MAVHSTNEVYEDVMLTADGKNRAFIEERAGRAFSEANQWRAALDVRQVQARNAYSTRAVAWSDVLHHLDLTATDTFDLECFRSFRLGPIDSVLWMLSGRLLTPFRSTMGSKPIRYYRPAKPVKARKRRGAGDDSRRSRP